jgi:signal transduction histidine kinase
MALNEIGAQADEALSELRDLARGIFPPLLADRGLARALHAHLSKQHPSATLETDAAANARFPPEVETAVYFCCREALQNAAKYAPDAQLSVRLEVADGALQFAIIDNGPGFDPAISDRGSGLHGMADRVAAVGGTLHVDAMPGRGTTVRGWVPVADRRGQEAEPRAADHNVSNASTPNSALDR